MITAQQYYYCWVGQVSRTECIAPSTHRLNLRQIWSKMRRFKVQDNASPLSHSKGMYNCKFLGLMTPHDSSYHPQCAVMSFPHVLSSHCALLCQVNSPGHGRNTNCNRHLIYSFLGSSQASLQHRLQTWCTMRTIILITKLEAFTGPGYI